MATPNQELYPVILIHGISGSRLISKQTVFPIEPPPISKVEEEYPIWLNLLMSSRPARPIPNDDAEINSNPEKVTLKTLGWNLPDATISSRTLPITPAPWWKTQMTLGVDGITAFNDEDNHPVEGFKAIERIAPDIEPDFDPETGKDNRYFAALIEKLVEQGYVKNENNNQGNLVAFPYDWRVSPKGLNEKYDYFNKLKKEIQKQREYNQKRVVIIAHSMGNRVTQYFLQWVKNKKELGEEWIHENIERYIAVSPPWLGGPLAIRFLGSDDPIVLGKAAIKDLKSVIQSYSSVPWLLPITKAPQAFLNTEHFAFVKENSKAPSTINNFQPKTIRDILTDGGAEQTTLKYQQEHYQNDNLIRSIVDGDGGKLVECPPVQKLDVIYAYGTPTHVGAYYISSVEEIDGEQTKSLRVAADLNDTGGNFLVKEGIRFEIEGTTTQLIDGSTHSGDGIVPYGSLAYHKHWQKDKSLKTEIGDYGFQLSDAATYPGHEEILKVNQGTNKILELLELSTFKLA
ncbi:hypothetical protein [Nostoc sp. C110]|uniref:lipase/acyltransferase domain-containing protein n=1 Tax=Nostoc sp. C110 TaxID=3349876 RepID=UPI00370D92CC